MSLLLDVLVIAVFACCLISGIKRGFIRSIMGMLALVVAVIGAIKLTPPMANYLNERYIDKVVTEKVGASLDSLISGVDSVDLTKLFEDKPQAFTDILERFGVNFEELKSYYENDLRDESSAEEGVSSYIAEPLSKGLSRAAAFAIIFVGFWLILTVVLMILDLVVKLPILNGANHFLGAVFGAAMGCAFAWGLSAVFCALMPHLAMIYDGVVPTSVIENTFIVKFLGELNVLRYI